MRAGVIDLEAERTVLVYALSGPLFARRCGLRADQFTGSDHRAVWWAIEQRCALHPDDDPTDFYLGVLGGLETRLGSGWRAQRVLDRIHEDLSGMSALTAVLMVRELAHRRLAVETGVETDVEPAVTRERARIFVDVG